MSVQSVPAVTIHTSMVSRPVSILCRTWLVTAPRRYFEMDRIVDFGIECIAEGSVLSSRFIPLLALRRNSSRYTLDQLAAIWAWARALPFTCDREVGFRRSDKSTTRERRRRQLRELSRGRGECYSFLSPSVSSLSSAVDQNKVYSPNRACVRVCHERKN